MAKSAAAGAATKEDIPQQTAPNQSDRTPTQPGQISTISPKSCELDSEGPPASRSRPPNAYNPRRPSVVRSARYALSQAPPQLGRSALAARAPPGLVSFDHTRPVADADLFVLQNCGNNNFASSVHIVPRFTATSRSRSRGRSLSQPGRQPERPVPTPATRSSSHAFRATSNRQFDSRWRRVSMAS